jgi:UDP-2,3-diacylglucosamine hydrolase
VLVAQGMRAAGARVCCVGLRDHFDAALPALCDEFAVVGIYRLGRWIHELKRHGVEQAVLVGRVSKRRMHTPLEPLWRVPDWRAVRVWCGRLGADRRTATVLTALADELRDNGIRLVEATTYITGHLAQEGVMTRKRISPQQEMDIAAGRPLLERVVSLDIGQSIAVCRGRVIAVESLEGTDAMIERAGTLDGSGWTLIKAPAPLHDMRFDVPAVGVVTVERLCKAQAGCLALEAGRVIMIDKPAVIAAAERAGIAIVGFRPQSPAPVLPFQPQAAR